MPNPTAPAFPPKLTEDMYWASKSPAVQKLRGNSATIDSQTIDDLVKAGELLDTQIMLWGWPAVGTMSGREFQGYTWVPSFGQDNIPVGPGINFPGLPSYDPNPPYPKGSIKVSTDPADYPPFTPPPPPPPPVPQPTCPVGIQEFDLGAPNGVGNYFGRAFGDKSMPPASFTGTTAQGISGTWELEGKQSLFNTTYVWVKKA